MIIAILSSLYKAFAGEEARRIFRKVEIHHTSKYRNWFSIAEIELNVMTRQCLSRCINSINTLRKELSAHGKVSVTTAAQRLIGNLQRMMHVGNYHHRIII